MHGGERRSRPERTVNARAANIQDVAKLADVSTATVSRALATPERVSAEARARVAQAIAETGYVPNPAARSLRSQKTYMVLVVLPDLSNTFFSRILRGVEETLFEAGYGMIVSDVDGSPGKEAHFAAFMATGRVDGAILLNGHLFGQGRDGEGEPAPLTAPLAIPLVALCEAIPDATIPQIEIDNRAGAFCMVRHLASLGHRTIAYVSGPPGNILERERFQGYREGLLAAGLPFDPDLVVPGDYTLEAGMAAGRTVAARATRPTAVFCTSDVMAIGAIRTLASAGLRVPDDVSVAGFDDIEFAAVAEPPLTTIHQPRRELGQAGATALIDLLQGRTGPTLIRLKSRLVIRASATAPAARPRSHA